MTELHTPSADADELFSTDTTGLALASATTTVRLHDGDRLDLRIAPVANRLGDGVVRMLAYNGTIPGPALHVDQGSEITVEVTNDGDTEATVHWHGLRLENRYDGVPHETQAPIPVGGTFSYKLQFPDAGFYWYHPHVREDFGLEMGLYGTIIVEPQDPSYWPGVDRQLTLTLDDLLVEDGRIASFHRGAPTFTAMGRFGNVMLTNGQTKYTGEAAVGEVVRLFLVNTANARIFNVALPGARMKLVGGDSGRYEAEAFVEEVLLSPSERAVVDVMFDTPGEVRLEHRSPEHSYVLGAFWVSGSSSGAAATSYDVLRTDPDLAARRRSLAEDLGRAPDKELAFFSLMPLLYGEQATPSALYACPMHPEVTGTEPATCPKCGMKLVASNDAPSVAPDHQPPHGHHDAAEDAPGDGIEWEDLMPDVNRQTNPTNMVWQIVDRHTQEVNGSIRWAFTVGDRVKIRLVNQMEGSEHPMHHPFHIHGAGRFLVLARNGAPEPNLVWKDTVLVPAGHTVDILLEVSNPGLWMAHCHIAEHAQTGMMFSFDVSRSAI